MTRDWWDNDRQRFDLYVSRLVVQNAPEAILSLPEKRLAFLQGIPHVEVPREADSLAAALLASVPLPEKAATDALHISVAAVNGIQFLLTWNCKHIANASLRPGFERVCRDRGYEVPVICTPYELLEINDVV